MDCVGQEAHNRDFGRESEFLDGIVVVGNHFAVHTLACALDGQVEIPLSNCIRLGRENLPEVGDHCVDI